MITDIFSTDKKYSVVYADPPWKYNDKASAGKRGACYKYPVMSLKEIESLPINNITNENAVLFLWITMPFLEECFNVMKAWGFSYKTIGFVWIKQNRKSDGLFWGMGNWTRSNCEICLIGIKGKPHRVAANVHSVVISHIEEHSKKPDEVRNRIVNLMGDVPKIELFARKEVDGWDCWGDEINQ